MHRTAIVFGAPTALGHALVSQLLDHDVLVTVARRWDEADRTSAEVRDAVAQLEDDSLVETLVGKNWVFVCAFPGLDTNAAAFTHRSVLAIRNLTAAAREAGVDRIVLTLPASTSWVPGASSITEVDRYLPGTAVDPWVDAFYALVQEATYAAADGVDCVVVAPALLVGDNVAPLKIGLARDARLVDVVHVSEAARMHVRAAQAVPWGGTVLLGGHSIERRRLADLIPAPRRLGLLGRGGDDPRRHLVEPGVRIDPTLAVEELGFNPAAGF